MARLGRRQRTLIHRWLKSVNSVRGEGGVGGYRGACSCKYGYYTRRKRNIERPLSPCQLHLGSLDDVMESFDFAPQINMLILKSKPRDIFHCWRIDFLVPFEVRTEIEVRLIHSFQPQEMHSTKGISGNPLFSVSGVRGSYGDRGCDHSARVVSQISGTRFRVGGLALHQPSVRAATIGPNKRDTCCNNHPAGYKRGRSGRNCGALSFSW